MMIKRSDVPFENLMSPTQSALGIVYLLLHAAVLPALLGLYQLYTPDPVPDATLNLVYYAIGIAFCLTVMFSFLRRSFDRLLDNLRLCLTSILLALMIDYALSAVAALALLLADAAVANPNNSMIMDMAGQDAGTVKAIAVFLAPIVEEILFRGAVFGMIRRRSRLWAYAVSAVAFSVYHVWQFAVTDPAMLLYALQYIPISVALAWAYERSGCIWTNIFFHMGFNAITFFVMNQLQ